VNRNGAFAEYIVMPASNLWPIPDQIPSELAAFFDPYGNAAHCALEFDVVGRTVLNFCANNYLGLADHPDIIAAAKDALDTHGFGMASVRFICGTQDLHKQLERGASPASSAPRTPSSTPPASTPTAACSRRCSASRTRSSPTRSTTPRSSTACACARPALPLRQLRHGRPGGAAQQAKAGARARS
jgi:hypothetical protein